MTTDTRPLSLAARAGLAGKAVFHVVLGLLVIQLVAGAATEQAGGQGAIDALARQPFGRALLTIVGLALAGYSVFRVWRVISPSSHGDGDSPAWVQRVASGVRALAYGALAVLAGRNVVTGRANGSSGSEARATERLLTLPGGVLLVVAAGVVVVVLGLRFGHRALTGDPLQACDLRSVGRVRRRTYAVVARSGLLGRALAFLLAGGFLVRAALRFDASQGVGLDAALHEVARSSLGAPLVLIVGAGVVLFGLHTGIVAVHGVVDRIE